MSQLKAIPASVNGWNAAYLEEQYHQFLQNAESVPADMRAFFQGFDLARAGAPSGASAGLAPSGDLRDQLRLALGTHSLIDAYRRLGHLGARLDPFGRSRSRPALLELSAHALSEQDLDKPVGAGDLPVDPGSTLRQIIARLEQTYCGTIGAQFMHISDDAQRQWLRQRCEANAGRTALTREDKTRLFEHLVRAEQFERFLQKRYPGDKRFSLEGGESTIAALERFVGAGPELGVQELVMGMAHRGRLNVLNNVLGKSYEQIFTEFEDNFDEDFADGGGDVKYHRGYSSTRKLPGGKSIDLVMASNPSHLESVNAVVLGRTRAKQRLRGDVEQRGAVVPILIHGDAAVIGQGVVFEALNMAYLEGYTVGGAVHLVINNLIGFTAMPEDSRSSAYCTDGALMVEAPVFHVSGEDPEAVVSVAQIAMEFRQRFKKDVFVDLWCFRKYGHNEQDEQSFTQPVLAELIKSHPGCVSRYAQRLVSEGVYTDGAMAELRASIDAKLDAAQKAAKDKPHDPTIDPAGKRWSGMGWDYRHDQVKTAVPMKVLEEVCRAWGTVPPGFEVNPKLKKLLSDRAALPSTGAISYADAESLAIGTLLLEGTPVRISGQDARRGTFSHRHAVLRDYKTGAAFTPLNAMRPIAPIPDDAGKPGPDGKLTQAKFCVYDSPLSEFAVMGFDYGYSLADPNMLVVWEGQFGDFANGAQTMIDQYLASAEIKWERWSGLVLALPHGYEGAGPEHSSARLERFLQLCADDNLQVVYPTTAAQIFHLLRRQVSPARRFRKPLVIMTPKSMLRVPTGHIRELTEGGFCEVLDDPSFDKAAGGKGDRKQVRRVLLCSGKIYHELNERRNAIGRGDTAIVRVEQLYPLHDKLLRDTLAHYPAKAELLWVQEEPRNAGAYLYMDDALRTQLQRPLAGYLGRKPSATPAVGSKHKHKDEQEEILSAAIGPAPASKPAPASAGSKKA